MSRVFLELEKPSEERMEAKVHFSPLPFSLSHTARLHLLSLCASSSLLHTLFPLSSSADIWNLPEQTNAEAQGGFNHRMTVWGRLLGLDVLADQQEETQRLLVPSAARGEE